MNRFIAMCTALALMAAVPAPGIAASVTATEVQETERTHAGEVLLISSRLNHFVLYQRFEVIDYESYANIGIGRPQALINRQTLERYKDNLALVVGLMGQRFGSLSGKAESGTQEEFELALEFHRKHGWPEIKWFFRIKPNPAFMPTDAGGMMRFAEQLAKVEDFRKRFEQGDPPLWHKTFPTTQDFPGCFGPDVQDWLSHPDRPWNSLPHPFSDPEAEAEDDGPWLEGYLRLLAEDCDHLPLNLLKAEESEATLGDVFVLLDVVRPPERDEAEQAEAEHLARAMARGEGDDRKPVFEMLAEHRVLVLIGDPGSGKSTLVNRLTQWLLAGEEGGTPFEGLLPLRVILRRVVPSGEKTDAGCIWRTLQADVADRLKLLATFEPGPLEREARRICRRLKARAAHPPGLLLMLDGLDEVSEAGNRRAHLLEVVQRLIDGLPAHNRFLVTARPYAYADRNHQLKRVPHAVLAPFSNEQLAQFMRNWHRVERGAKGLSEAEAEARADDLIRRLDSRPEVRRLAERPLHASMIASLNLRGNRLPEDRCQLYEEIIDLLLMRWRSGEAAFRNRDGQLMDLPEKTLNGCLETLAYLAHAAQRASGSPRDAADISEAMIEQAFRPLLDHHGRLDLLNYLRRHAGILIGREEQRFAFPHRAFQEYLAMRHLAARTDDSLIAHPAKDPLWWREIFRLAVAVQRKSPRNGIYMVWELLKRSEEMPAEQTHAISLLCGLALLELDLTQGERKDATHDQVRTRIVALIEDPDALGRRERLEAGLTLGRLGDPRPGVGLHSDGLPDIQWVEIRAGEFIYQNGERRSLPAFSFPRSSVGMHTPP